MSVEMVGDELSAHEILFKIKQWDHAICKMDINEIVQLCASDVSLFDAGTELQGVRAYQEMWERYRPFFHDKIQIFRKDIKIHAQPGLAVLHCYSKVDSVEMNSVHQVPWCRTTLCFEKIEGRWKVVHQHISMPVDFETQKVVMRYF